MAHEPLMQLNDGFPMPLNGCIRKLPGDVVSRQVRSSGTSDLASHPVPESLRTHPECLFSDKEEEKKGVKAIGCFICLLDTSGCPIDRSCALLCRTCCNVRE